MTAPRPWHARGAEDVLAELGSSRAGLTAAQAAAGLARHGENRLPPARRTSAFAILAGQLKSVVVLLLVVAAVVSFLLGERVEAIAIAAVLAVNTLIGFVTEWRARRAMDALLELEPARALVVRDGRLQAVGAESLVPGDVIQVEAGQHVPADGRLLQATDSRFDEAPLTGESMPVTKQADAVHAVDVPLAERTTMIYQGTTAVAGITLAVVTETGARTELGRIGALTDSIRPAPTPLERRLDVLGRRLVGLALLVAVVVAALGALQGHSLALVFKLGIALAVAAVPEALPAVATVALAVSVRRMARRNALVRRLPAVETLGSTTVVCTDKTGTLTSGRMAAVRLWTRGATHDLGEVEGDLPPPLREALVAAVLASRPQAEEGEGKARVDPVDRAFLAAGSRAGVERANEVAARPQAGLVPFTSESKFMASFHREEGGLVAYVKGAPGRILELARRRAGPDGPVPLDDAGRQELVRVNDEFAAGGLRVLAVARGRVERAEESAIRDLEYVATVGLADPPAEGVMDTIARLRGAGLRTVMLTGDQRLTAEAVGRELGLLGPGDRAIEGRELDALDDAELDARLATTAAFARINPGHKLKLVQRLQARGEIVAMLGDGVNDAPALRQADIGVAMGRRGTDVARQAAAIVLQDDRFETVGAAVEEGRVTFDNIRKFVFYLFSCNLAEVLVLLFAGLAGLPLPLLPLQILWLNMITDTFPALALALEPADSDVMDRPPRDPDEAVLSRRFVTPIVVYAALITASTLTAFALSQDGPPERARTIAFMTLAVAQILHLGNARSVHAVLGLRAILANRYALGAAVLALALQVLTVTVDPLAGVLGLVPLGLAEWGLVIGLALVPAVAGQVFKLRRRDPA